MKLFLFIYIFTTEITLRNVGVIKLGENIQKFRHTGLFVGASSNISPVSLQEAHVEDEKESRRRRSPLRNRSDFNESRSFF